MTDSKKTVLIIDDEEDIVILLNEILHTSYNVVAAQSVADAIPIARQTQIDMVITDLAMPGQAGEIFISWVRSNMHDIPILALSGFPDRKDQVLGHGAWDWLDKPFYSRDLLEKVGRLMSKSEV